MNPKKIALIAVFLVATIGIGYLLYRVFFGAPVIAPSEEPVAPETGVPSPGLPTSEAGRPTVPGAPTPPVGLPTADAIARGGSTQTHTVKQFANVVDPIVTSSGTLNFYDSTEGKFYRRLDDGSIAAMTSKTFPNVQKVDWSPAGTTAVLEFPDESKIIYDFEKQRQVTLPKHWEDFDFSGDGRSVAAKSMAQDPSNRWLITFDSTGQSTQLIEPLGENADKVIVEYSPDNSVVAFSDTAEPVGFESKDYLLIGRNGENFKSLRVEGFGFEPLWSPDGANLLYSAAAIGDDFTPKVWFSGAKGQQIGAHRTDLEINTWADKCTFSGNDTVFCAVPDSLPEGAGLQREVADGIPDSIVKIDLRSGTKSVVGRPATDTSIERLLISKDGSSLFFTNAATGSLEEMRLK